jgi:hypothetical protein
MGEMRDVYKIFVRKPAKGRDHSEDLGVGGRTGCIWFRVGTGGGLL